MGSHDSWKPKQLPNPKSSDPSMAYKKHTEIDLFLFFCRTMTSNATQLVNVLKFNQISCGKYFCHFLRKTKIISVYYILARVHFKKTLKINFVVGHV